MGNFGSKSRKAVRDSSNLKLKSASFVSPKRSSGPQKIFPSTFSSSSSSSSPSPSPSPSRCSSLSDASRKTLGETISEEQRIESFEILKTLGTGSYGRVVLARHHASGSYVAIKILKKTDVVRRQQVEHVKDELRILRVVQDCPHVVRLLTSFQDARNLYLVMEFVEGGELFVHLRRSLRFSEEVASYYAAEVVLTWDYFHQENIMHRDLKPENLLLTHDGHIKLTDFGFARRLHDDVAWTVCGTPEYLAPEVILCKGYGKAADWWALGVLLFEMLTGFSPFFDEDAYQIHENILAGKIEYPSYLKPTARDLISKLLTADLTQRLGNLKNGSEDIKRHPFFAGIDWEALKRREQVPPFAPALKGEGDASFFLRFPEDPALLPAFNERDLYAGLFPDFSL